MEFCLGSCTYTFRGTITLTCGDNLASYFVGGYKQLSSAFRKCRFCLAVSTDMQEKVSFMYMCIQRTLYMCVSAVVLCNGVYIAYKRDTQEPY